MVSAIIVELTIPATFVALEDQHFVIFDGATSGSPTAIISEAEGTSDAIVFQPLLPDSYGFGESSVGPFQLTPTDAYGFGDAIPTITADVTPTDAYGGSDVMLLEIDESAQARSGTPDSDSWGDAWVDRTAGQTGVNHGNETTMQVSAVTAITQQDGFCKINFNRLVSLVAQATGSTLTFTVAWPTVALNPSATLQVDFQTSAGSPFTESAITAANEARFASGAPFSQRTFTFAQDGTVRTHTVTFTTAETDNILGGRWLLIQFTVPNLTAGTFQVRAREFGGATVMQTDFFVTEA